MDSYSEEYLMSLLGERYKDGVDRREQRIFDGYDIKKAFEEGAKSAAFIMGEMTGLFDEDDDDDDEEMDIINNN